MQDSELSSQQADLIGGDRVSDSVSRDEVYIAIASTSFISDPNYADGKVLLYEEDLKHRIDELPSAEPKIIRCKDCKHWFDIDDGRQRHERCADVGGYWYCADAERREDE